MSTKTLTKIFLLFSICLMILPQSFILATEVEIEDPTPDLEAPILKNISISSNSITPTDSIILIAEISDGDQGSGVKNSTITYRKANGASQTFNLVYNSKNQLYEAEINVGQYETEGTWTVLNVVVKDYKDNERTILHSTSAKTNDTFDFSEMFIDVSGTIKVPEPEQRTDFEAPILKDVSIASNEVENGNNIQLSVVATDNESGIWTAVAVYSKPSGDRERVTLTKQQASNTFTSTYLVKPYDEPGLWQLTAIELADRVGNRQTYINYVNDLDETKSLDHGNVLITGTTIDNEAPILKSIEIQSNNVKNKEAIRLTFEATDNLSGISSIYANYKQPSGNTFSISFYRQAGTDNYIGSRSIGQYDELGVYELVSVTVRDIVGNTRTYDRSTQIYDGLTSLNQFDVIISGTTPDLEAPTLEHLKIGVSQLTSNTAEVVFTAEPKDLISGVSTISGQYARPSGRIFNLNFTKTGNSYVAKIIIDKYDELGEWKLTSISLMDNRGNSKTLRYKNTPGDFSNFYFTVKGKITVSPAIPDDIESIHDLELGSGETYQLKPILKYTDGTKKDISSDSITEYSSSNLDVITVNSLGLITANKNADSTKAYIEITYGTITEKVWVIINGGSEERFLEVTPTKTNLSSGQQQQLKVVEVNAGGRKDITSSQSGVTYLSSNPSLVSVSKEGLLNVTVEDVTGSSTILITYEGLQSRIVVNITKPTIKYLLISPEAEKMSLTDNKMQLIVKAFMSNGSTKDVTASNTGTTYSTSNKSIANVDSEGFVTIPLDAKSGEVIITAKNGVSTVKSVIQVEGNPELQDIVIKDLPEVFHIGDKIKIELSSLWSDGTIKKLDVNDVDITITYPSRVSIFEGELEAKSKGPTYIDFKYEGKLFRKRVEVLAGATIESFYIDDDLFPSLMQIGEKHIISGLKGKWTDGNVKDIDINDVEISSTYPSRVTVTNGELEARSKGSVYIDIKYEGKIIRKLIGVEAGPTLVDFYIEDSLFPSLMQVGVKHMISGLKGKWTDGNVKDIDINDVEISSTYPSRVTVTNGELEARSKGSVYIDIKYEGKIIRKLIGVEAGPTLVDFYIEDSLFPSLMQVGEKHMISGLKGKWTDGNVKDIDINDVEISSTYPSRVTVTNGELEARSKGSVYIDIKYEGKIIRKLIGVEAGPTLVDFYIEDSLFPSLMQVGEKHMISGLKGKWTDGNVKDIDINDVEISSTYPSRVTVTNGELEARSKGSVYIDIKYEGKIIRKLIGVEAGPTLVDFYIEDSLFPSLMQVGEKHMISGLKGKWTDGNVKDIDINDVEISSTYPSRVTVTNGELEAKSKGSVYIDIKYEGKIIRKLIGVEAGPTLVDIYIEDPLFPSLMQIGEKYMISGLKGKWTDGNIKDIDINDVEILSTYPSRVTVANGELEAKSKGSLYIDFKFEGKSIRKRIDVSAGITLDSIYMEDPLFPSSMIVGQKYTINGLKGKLSDGNVIDLNVNDVEITSTYPSRVTVKNGELDAITKGAVYIDFKYEGKNLRLRISVL
ncbi:hypothetical protein [Sporosarcina sp. UB5]|uniref:hypothetical protein n=1 Tax=Sporosarcina sp. UB5 TaxID=3047463 RepID=UPI003D7BAD48